MEPINQRTEPTINYSGRNLLLIFLFLSASILTVGYIVYRNSEKNFRAEVDRQLSAIADLRVRDLQLWRAERLGDGNVLFKNDSITALARAFLGKPSDGNARRQFLMWFDKEQKSYHYDGVWLLDAHGATRLTSPPGAGAAPPVILKSEIEILKSGRVALQDFYRDKRDQRVYMGVLIPLFDETQQPLGVIDLRIDPEIYLYPYLKQWPGESQSGETALLRRDGDEAVLLNDSRFGKNTALNIRASMSHTELPAVQALLGREGVIDEPTSYFGVPVVAALRAVPGTPWALVVRRNTSEVFEPLRHRIGEIVAMVVLLLFASGAGVGMIWRQQNSRLYRERAESLEEKAVLNVRYRQFFEATRNGVLIVDTRTGVIVDVNPYLIQLLGYPRHGYIRKKVWELDCLNGLAANEDEFAALSRKGPGYPEQMTMETREGHKTEVEVTHYQYRVGDQELIQFNFYDVTARMKAEEELRRSELFFRAVIENALDGVTIIEPDGNIRYTSPAVKNILGYEVSEMVNTNGFAYIHPEDAPAVGQALSEVLSSPDVSRVIEFRFKHKDGTWRVVETAGKSHFFTHPDFQGVVLNYRDVTESWKARQNQRFLNYILEQTAEGIVVADLDLNIIQWNKGAEKIFGYRAEEILGKPGTLLNVDDGPDNVAQKRQALKETGSTLHYEAVRKGKDGRLIHLDVSSTPLKDGSGQLIGYSAIYRDITERKKMESELAENQERFRHIFEDSPMGVALVGLDSRLLMVNQSFSDITGYSPEELKGKSFADITHPEEAARDLDQFRRMIVGEFPRYQLEKRFIHKKGHDVWVTRAAAVIRDDKGKPLYGLGMIMDINDKKKSEEVRSQLTSILEQTPDAVTGVDLNGNISSWNRGAEAMLGYSAEEVLGKPITILARPGGEEELRTFREALFKDGKVKTIETIRMRKDGSLVDVSLVLYLIRDSHGKVVGSSGILRDITERKKAEEASKKHEDQMRLAQKMDAIGRLAGGVAHDFNNLLSVVGGNAEFVQRNLESGIEPTEELQDIMMAVQQGAELTKQLLVFSKKQVSQPEPISPNQICVQMNKMFKRVIDPKIEFKLIQDKEPKYIQADSGQIQQVILNLVINARDAMPNGGKLMIETDHLTIAALDPVDNIPPGSYVRLKVTDTGTGMSPEVQQRIFEPFFSTKADKGTGLGLATVYAIVKNWGGHILVHSILGAGTTFSIYFPALDSTDGVKTEAKQEEMIPMGSETILVAEDEGSFRKILVRTLEQYGYKVLQGADGAEALEAASKYDGKIDLLLTDTVMPKMNGKELADAVKKARPGIKAIFTSGYAQELLSEQGILDQDIHLIQKPFSFDFLMLELRKVLEGK